MLQLPIPPFMGTRNNHWLNMRIKTHGFSFMSFGSLFRGDLTAAQVVFAPSVLSTLSYMDIPNPSLVSRRFGLLWVGEAFLAKCLQTVQVQDKILVSPSEGLAEFLGNPLILVRTCITFWASYFQRHHFSICFPIHCFVSHLSASYFSKQKTKSTSLLSAPTAWISWLLNRHRGPCCN